MKVINEFFTWVKNNDWQIEVSNETRQFPIMILQRYPNIPIEYQYFYERINLCSNSSDTSWFLSASDFIETNEDRFI